MAHLLFILLVALLPALSFGAGTQPMGRLFFSAEQRHMLDQLRRNDGRSADAAAATTAAVTDQIKLDGVVKRSSGKTTVWINQQAQHENQNPQGIHLLSQAAKAQALSLRLPSGKITRLKAGQSLDTATGKVREAYDIDHADHPGPP